MGFRLAVFLLAAACSAQQQPASNAGPEPASLSGRVTGISGQPLRKVTLTLRLAHVQPGERVKPYVTTSGAEGKFAFESVDAGRYVLWAEKAGFLRQAYGSKHADFSGTNLTLSPGQHMTDLAFELTPQAALTGRVLDEDGDPAGQTNVEVLRLAYANGKKRLTAFQSSMSDENGEFKISGLAPGRYFVCASAPFSGLAAEGGRSAKPIEPKGPREDYAPTCYPNAPDPSSAVPVDVSPGRDASNLDIRLRKSAVVHVKGQVTGALSGRPLDRLQISLRAADSGFGFGSSGRLDKDGGFDLPNVHAGSYRLVVLLIEGMVQTVGSMRLEVGNEDVDGVSVTLTSPAPLQGAVIIQGEPAAPAPQTTASGMRVSLYDSGLSNYVRPTTVAEDGSFAFSSVAPGKYSVTLSGMPDGAYLRSVRIGNQEAAEDSVDLSSGVAGDLKLILKMAAGQVDGTVQDDHGQAAGGALVTLLPDPPQPASRGLLKQVSSDQNGVFILKSVKPGKYRLYAWEDLEPGAAGDPDFLKPHESKSVAVTIEENGRERVVLKRISLAEVEAAKAKAGN